MTHVRPVDPPVRVTIADGRVVRIKTVGTLNVVVTVRTHAGEEARALSLANVYHVPTLAVTLLSVSQLVHSGHFVRFEANEWTVMRGRRRAEVLHAPERGGVYEVVTPESIAYKHGSGTGSGTAFAVSATNRISLATWHRRLGHLNLADCRRMAATAGVRSVVISDVSTPPACRSCALAKVNTASAPKVRRSSDAIADGVCHMDLSGPVKRSYHGHEYFMVIVWRDYIRVFGLRSKDEASDKAAEFLRFIERQARVKATSIRTIRTDGGTEFMGADFRKLVTDEGLRHQHTTRYRSSQNGVAERAIRTLTEMAAAILIDSHLPHYLWEDALRHAAYIRNRIPKRNASITPHERLFGAKPSLTDLPIFGQSVVVRTPEPIRRKTYRFDGRGIVGAFVGFSEEIRGYRVYIPGHGRPIKETTDVVLLDAMLVDEVVLDDEQEPPSAENDNENEEYSRSNEVEDQQNGALQLASRRSRQQKAISSLRDTSWRPQQVEEINGTSELTRRRRSERISARNIDSAFLCLADVIREPLTLAGARRSPQWRHWDEAIRKELGALEENHTFVLVDPPPGAHVLDNTLQFRIKTGPTGEIVQYKARICARGDTQVYLLDYVETRAPVADLICVRIFLILAVRLKLKMRQGDVPAAYLKADLQETVFVRQVKGFEVPGQEHKVWRLRKALYGLKQAGREWNHEIDSFLKNYGLKATTGDECLYFSWVANGLLLVCLYVDDILVAHPSELEVVRLMAALNMTYKVKDMGEPSQFVGVRIDASEPADIRLSQENYLKETLHRFAMLPARPTPTPMIPNTRLDQFTDIPSEAEVNEMKRMPYRQVVGSLLYLARLSRPDIAFAVNQLARHCAKPRHDAWIAAKYLLRYLAGTQGIKLRLAPDREGIDLVTDADLANDRVDRKSVSGFVVFLYGAPVAWDSSKQSVVAQSSTAAEFIAANDGLLQADWIKLLVDKIFAGHSTPLQLTLKIDSVPAIHRIKREGSAGTQKAVDIRFHALKDAWNNAEMALEYTPTGDNPADLLTKSLPRTQLRNKRGLCGLI